MDHYIDMTIRPDPEFPPDVLLSELFSKLHRALVDWGEGNIGVSFPEVGEDEPTLGKILRLHGTRAALLKLMDSGWLRGMRDYIGVHEVATVPVVSEHRVVRRVQVKSNVERIRRRQIKRHGLTDAQARERIPDTAVQRLNLPYINMTSASTGQPFPLFIEHGVLTHEAKKGYFNSYGLSATSTIPWF